MHFFAENFDEALLYPMTTETTSSRQRWLWLWSLLAISAALLALFHGLLAPSEVMFSNDTPFGVLKNHENDGVGNLKGFWMTSNWVGTMQLAAVPTFSHLFFFLVNAVTYGKMLVPLSLLFLGLAATFFCYQSGFHPAIGPLIGLAAALNSNPVSYACWGLAPKALTMGCVLFAVGFLQGAQTQGIRSWIQVLLAGFFVGFGVMEGADVGAIFSLYVAGFAVWNTWNSDLGDGRLVRSGARMIVVSVAAAWIASHALFSLINTQIKGIAQPSKQAQSEEAQWQFATSWSVPPEETIRLLVPGIMGYRMDTADGGAYWGGVGQDGTARNRFSGNGEYAGILVVLTSAFGVFSSLRGKASPLRESEKKMVWFWAAMALVSLWLSFGRLVPGFLQLYRVVFALPYFSTIRSPQKFMHVVHITLWILSAYGLESLARLYLNPKSKAQTGRTSSTWIDAWDSATHEGRLAVKWSGGLLAVAFVAAVIYTSRSAALAKYLSTIDFNQGERATALFSIREVWIAVGFLTISVAWLSAVILGFFCGSKTAWAWVAFGLIVAVDLVRSDVPWVKHYDYVQRHDRNPLIERLADHPWEHRVTAFLNPRRDGILVPTTEFVFLSKEWLENHFQFYQVQSLDIDQMPRVPELESEYLSAFMPPRYDIAVNVASLISQMNRLNPEQKAQVQAMLPEARANLAIFTRLWQLTNTRYLLGWREGLDAFNNVMDPVEKRFQVAIPYRLELKPGATPPTAKTPIAEIVERVTAVADPQGQLALLEFTGALPRAKLYSQWEIHTNNAEALARLISPQFNPSTTVVLSQEPGDLKSDAKSTPGEAGIVQYGSKHIQVHTKTPTSQVLLFNDRWHEDWKAFVDGRPVPLLRANHLMRGVVVPAGEHQVEFVFSPPSGTLWVSLSALIVAVLSVGFLGLYRPATPKT